MTSPPLSLDEALEVLGDPEDPRWLRAFALLARHPDTAGVIQATFRETLEEMGARPTGVDPRTGEPVFSLADVARALGIPESALEDPAAGGAETPA